MRLLAQGDDYGFTRGVTMGIIDSIDRGILRNTGLFANMPAAEYAVSFMADRPQVCFGIDFNLVAGRPCSDPRDIPALVDAEGKFKKSGVYVRDPRYATLEGRAELFPQEECDKEIHAQYARFLELTGGRKPGYLHAHSIMPENYMTSIRKMAEESGIPFSMDITAKLGFVMPKGAVGPTTSKVFDPNAQLAKDTTKILMDCADDLAKEENVFLVCHPGYIDADLLTMTTLSLERCKDAAMYQSAEVRQWVEDNKIELINYYDLY